MEFLKSLGINDTNPGAYLATVNGQPQPMPAL